MAATFGVTSTADEVLNGVNLSGKAQWAKSEDRVGERF